MPLIIVFALVGGAAQFVDGSLGMGFGVTSATLLTLLGYSAVAASAGTHAAKMGTTFVSGLAHWREGNVDWRVFTAIAVPGSVGAFTGAVILTNVSLDGARLWMALILLVLGISIIMRFAFGKKFKGALCVVGVARKADGDIGGEAGGAGGGRDDGAVPLNRAAPFQILHPAQAGRGRKADLGRELLIRDAAILCKDAQDPGGYRINFGIWLF